MHKIIISILCMILIVSLPICFAEETKEEELTAEEGYTDLIINVKKYEPTVVVSSLLEEQNVPVYAYLSAIPTEGLSLPRIQSISVSVIGGNKSNLVGGATYHKPLVYSFDDMGYIEVKLRKIEKEEKIPDKIDINLNAKIRYEGEVTSALLGGVETKNLTEDYSVELNDILGNERYSFFGDKGYIRTERIAGKTATFVLYNGEGEVISRFSVGEGKESSAYSLIKGSTEAEDFVRVRIDKVIDKTLPHVIIKIWDNSYDLNVGDKIGGWQVTNINVDEGKVELRKDKEIADLIYDVVIPEKLKEDFGSFTFEINKGEKKEAIFNVGKTFEGEKIDNTECNLLKVENNYVRVIDKEKKEYDLSLITEAEKERYYSPSVGQIRYSDVMSCNGQRIQLLSIDTKKSVMITLMTGKRIGYTESVFSLHLPVEKRPFDLSPRALDKKINKTREQIESLNKKYINNLEKLVTEWRKVCLVVTATMLVYGFFKGLFTKAPVETKIEEKEKKIEKAVKELEDSKTFTPHEKNPRYFKLNSYNSGGKNVYIFDKNMDAFYTYDGKNFQPVDSSIISDKENKPVYWRDEGGFKEYTGLKGSEELNKIFITEVRDEKATIIPLRDVKGISVLERQYSEWVKRGIDTSKGLYAVVYDDGVEIWQGMGEKIDVGDKDKLDELDRQLTDRYSKNTDLGKRLYRDLDNKYLKKLASAKAEGKKKVSVDGKEYAIDSTTSFVSTKLKCIDVLDPWQCVILYNACDPVICPASRCNWNEEYNVKSITQSGLIGSTYLCLGNWVALGGDVVVPVCLSGILAALKNIRSYLQSYEKCLTTARNEGKSTGICDKISSIYICEIIWKEMINFFNLKGGVLGLITRKIFSSGGGEYFESPVEKGLDNSKKVVDFFVNEYATEMFAAYAGRSTEEIGTELCKNAIAGKFPNLGEFMEELAEPEDPVQFTAYFEEHPYAPTRGESRYQVYYHIYAGSPKRTESVDYKVYLKSKGKQDRIVGQGILEAGESADESVDIIAYSGYQEICVVINGVPKCGFGKSVSTSFLMEQVSKEYMEKVGGLAPKITKASQCVSEEESVGAGYVPKAAVKRVCAISNPYLGLGQYKEREWNNVGKCIDEKGNNLGFCWQQADLTNYPELKEDVSEDVCVNQNGIWCNVNQTCKEGAILFTFDDKTLGHRECCLGGSCEKIVEEKQVDEEYKKAGEEKVIPPKEFDLNYLVKIRVKKGEKMEGGKIITDYELGTGFVIKKTGVVYPDKLIIATAKHIIGAREKEDTPIEIYLVDKSQPFSAKLVFESVDLDLMLLEISDSGGIPVAELDGKVNLKDVVYTAGYDKDVGDFKSKGGLIISYTEDKIKTTAKSMGGYSGGILLNEGGKVIGMLIEAEFCVGVCKETIVIPINKIKVHVP